MRTQSARPPIGVLIRYRLFGSRVPPEWTNWVADDLARPGWLGRGHFWVALAPVVVVQAADLVLDAVRGTVTFWSFSVLWLVAPLAVLFVLVSPRLEGAAFYGQLRERILAYHTGTGPHPTFGTESPRSMLGVVVVAALIAFVIVLVVRLLT